MDVAAARIASAQQNDKTRKQRASTGHGKHGSGGGGSGGGGKHRHSHQHNNGRHHGDEGGDADMKPQTKESRASDILFHLFRLKHEKLIEDYSCAISAEILLHGRMVSVATVGSLC